MNFLGSLRTFRGTSVLLLKSTDVLGKLPRNLRGSSGKFWEVQGLSRSSGALDSLFKPRHYDPQTRYIFSSTASSTALWSADLLEKLGDSSKKGLTAKGRLESPPTTDFGLHLKHTAVARDGASSERMQQSVGSQAWAPNMLQKSGKSQQC